jgi:tetratricopeptide (TPR) repeat protein
VESREGPAADFSWSFEDDLGYEGRQVTAVRFHAPGKQFKWNFGDGVTSTEASPLHVYLNAGQFSVTLQVDGRSVTQNLQIRPARGHLGRQYEKRLQLYAERIFTYPTDGLPPEACFEMGMICHEARRFESAARGFRAALEKGYKPRDGEEARWVMRLFELYRDGGRYDDALWVCEYMLQNKPPDAVAVAALNMKAEILYDYQDKPEAAEACCKTILEKYGKTPTDFVRAAYLRLGEFAMVRGRRDEAKKILEDAQTSDKWRKWNGDFELTEGAHSINFEEYMRQNEFEGAWREIQGLVWEQPLTLLSGQAREMRARVFLATRKYDLALREFDRAMAADPKAPFADEALLWKAQCYEALKQRDKALECYRKLVNEYPESQLVPRAKEKLK